MSAKNGQIKNFNFKDIIKWYGLINQLNTVSRVDDKCVYYELN